MSDSVFELIETEEGQKIRHLNGHVEPIPEGRLEDALAWAEETLCKHDGRVDNSFGCKIRHAQINTGAAKAANDMRQQPLRGFNYKNS